MDIRHKPMTNQAPRTSVISRLCKIVTKRMTVKEIEFEYIAKFGRATHKTILFELSNLCTGGVIKRVKQGVYEP
jgi:hypothetical protein